MGILFILPLVHSVGSVLGEYHGSSGFGTPVCFNPLWFLGMWKFFPSEPSLFDSVFDKYDEEEDSEVSVVTVRVMMLLMVIISSEALISLTSVAYLMMYVNRATHLLYIFKYSGSVSLIHR